MFVSRILVMKTLLHCICFTSIYINRSDVDVILVEEAGGSLDD